MANVLLFRNTNSDAAQRPAGVPLYYLFPETKINEQGQSVPTDCDDGFAMLLDDPARESLIKTVKPEGDYTFFACDQSLDTHKPYYTYRNSNGQGGGTMLTYAYQPLVVRYTATNGTPALPAGQAAVTTVGGSYTKTNLIPAGFPATQQAVHPSVPDGTYVITFELPDGTVLQSVTRVVSASGPNEGYDQTDTPSVPTLVRAQLVDTQLRYFEHNGVTRQGYAFFNAVDNAAAPAPTAGNVYFVLRTGSDTAAQTLARVRGGAVVTYSQGQISAPRTSAIVTLTPSISRPSWVEGIGLRGIPGEDVRIAFDTTTGKTNLKVIVSTLTGNVIPGLTLPNPSVYQDVADDNVLDSNLYQSVIRLHSPAGGGIQAGTDYLVSLERTTNGAPEYYTHKFRLPLNPNAQITALTLPPVANTGGGGGNSNDSFTAHDLAGVQRIGLQVFDQGVEADGSLPADYNELYDVAAEEGAKLAQPSLSWGRYEPLGGGGYDRRSLDAAGNKCVAKGMLLTPRLTASRNPNNYDVSFLPESAIQLDHLGHPLNVFDNVAFSFASAAFGDKVEAWVRDVCNHAKTSNYASVFAGLSVVFSGQEEGEYRYDNKFDNVQYSCLADYSAPAQAQWRSWLQNNNGYAGTLTEKLTALNNDCGTAYANWSEVGIPIVPQHVPDSPFWNFDTVLRKRFYLYRTWSLAQVLNRMAAAVKSISPKLNYTVEYGNAQDALSPARGTSLLTVFLSADVNIIKSNDGPDYPVELSTAMALRDHAPGQGAANEVFASGNQDQNNGNGKYTVPEMVSQFVRCFSAGCGYVVLAGPYIAANGKKEVSLQRLRDTFTQVRQHPSVNLDGPAKLDFEGTFTAAQSRIITHGLGAPYDGLPTLGAQYEAARQATTNKRKRFKIDPNA